MVQITSLYSSQQVLVQPSARLDFLKEATVMVQLSHPCILSMYGICENKRLMMLLELAPLGSLLDYLQVSFLALYMFWESGRGSTAVHNWQQQVILPPPPSSSPPPSSKGGMAHFVLVTP